MKIHSPALTWASVLLAFIQGGCSVFYSPKTGNPPKQCAFEVIYSTYKDIREHPFPGNLEEEILSHGAENQVILFGENHEVPVDDCFVGDLLERLYQEGYHRLMVELPQKHQSAVEQFMEKRLGGDELLEEVGLKGMTDFLYILTKARESGMTVYCMDVNDVTDKKVNRDKEMSKVIERVLNLEPSSKLVVFVGLDHVLEGNYYTFPKGRNNLLDDECRIGCQVSEMTDGQSYSIVLDRGYAAMASEKGFLPITEGIDADLIANPPLGDREYHAPDFCAIR